jgi:hypothetical protein
MLISSKISIMDNLIKPDLLRLSRHVFLLKDFLGKNIIMKRILLGIDSESSPDFPDNDIKA